MFCLKKALSIIIKEVLPVALRYGNNWTFQQDNRTPEWCSQHFLTRIHDQRNSPDLNPLNYCIWDEFARAINCDKVTWKSSLIAELKRGVKKNSFGCCMGKLFRLDESFVSHDTKRWKLSKRIKSSLSDRESKDESL